MTPDAVFVGTVLVMAAGLAAAWGGEWLADRRQARWNTHTEQALNVVDEDTL